MTITVTHSTVADASFSATGAAAWDATHSFAGILDVANGGTGTATPALVAGTNVTITGTWPNQTIAASGGGGSGTVTSVSVASANGFAGTVANATTTPAVTLSTSITGVLKGDGTAISAASAGTDYQAPITLTTTGTSGAATFVSNTLNIPQYSGGGGSGTVTSVDATVPAFLSVSGGPITTSGTLAISYSGTALPIANGGTGQTTAAAAITALTGTQTSGYYLRSDGTNATLSAIQAADVPTLNQNTTGTASNVTGTVAVANGGTGTTTPALVAGTNVTITGTWPNQTIAASGGGSGTVTSVAATVPAFLSVTGSPITTSGTLAIAYSGTALPIANGGTGQTTASAAFNALSPITTTGDLILGNGTNSATRLAIGTNGQVLFSNGSTAAWGSAIASGTAVASTSGTSIDFTSIPSWVKRVTVIFQGVSTNGTSNIMVQLGTSASFLATGYVSSVIAVASTTSGVAFTTGLGFNAVTTAAPAYSGQLVISLLDSTSNFWSYSSVNSTGGTTLQVGGGGVALASTLTRVRLTTVGGTNTFDAGTVNIMFE